MLELQHKARSSGCLWEQATVGRSTRRTGSTPEGAAQAGKAAKRMASSTKGSGTGGRGILPRNGEDEKNTGEPKPDITGTSRAKRPAEASTGDWQASKGP